MYRRIGELPRSAPVEAGHGGDFDGGEHDLNDIGAEPPIDRFAIDRSSRGSRVIACLPCSTSLRNL